MRLLERHTHSIVPSRRTAPHLSAPGLRSKQLRTQIYSNNVNPSGDTYVLEAIYYGRALAELLSEKIGLAAIEYFSELGKWDAERRQALREFQDEVLARARKEMGAENPQRSIQQAGAALENAVGDVTRGGLNVAQGRGATGSSKPSSPQKPSPDLEEAVDDLRADIASARAVLLSLKNKVRSGSVV